MPPQTGYNREDQSSFPSSHGTLAVVSGHTSVLRHIGFNSVDYPIDTNSTLYSSYIVSYFGAVFGVKLKTCSVLNIFPCRL